MGHSFRDSRLAEKTVRLIEQLAQGESYTFMHVCGTHEQSITRHGLRSLLPENINLISGPGCPVCITPSEEIDTAIAMAKEGVSVFTYGDMFRVPGSEESLASARAKGHDTRIALSISEGVKIAKKEKEREFVFFSPGLDTTAPTVASEALKGLPENLTVLSSLRLTVPVMELLLGIGDLHFSGYLAPGHVSAVIGSQAYRELALSYSMPVVVSGFEPLDVLMSVAMLLKQVREGESRVENEYTRVVGREGNPKAREALDRVFEVATARWRGIGRVPFSALKFREEFSSADALRRHGIKAEGSEDIHPGCSCHLVITGKLGPEECALFGKTCTPEGPYGPCMVSSEGSCNIYFRYGGYR